MKTSRFTPEEHLFFFSKFCKFVGYAGGATPHLKMVVASGAEEDPKERLWRGCCYGATYNFSSAEIIWRSWPRKEVLANSENDKLKNWLQEHWEGIPLRKERKAVRSPQNLSQCLLSFAKWTKGFFGRPHFMASADIDPIQRYDQAWEDIFRVKYIGRYMSIRFLHYVKLAFSVPLIMPDIRPVGGSFPRQSLSLMYPQYKDELLGGNSEREIRVVNEAADLCLHDLKTRYGLFIDHYTLQSLSCEYKQSVLGKKQYPAKSIDSEIGYWHKVYDKVFKKQASGTQFWEVRKRIFPKRTLGEIQGWDGPREPLMKLLFDHGYVWSDIIYDYKKTKDFARPVRR